MGGWGTGADTGKVLLPSDGGVVAKRRRLVGVGERRVVLLSDGGLVNAGRLLSEGVVNRGRSGVLLTGDTDVAGVGRANGSDGRGGRVGAGSTVSLLSVVLVQSSVSQRVALSGLVQLVELLGTNSLVSRVLR
jgi:hypothetical protein